MLDIFTLLSVLALIHFLVTCLICLAWSLFPSMLGVKLWAIGRVLTTLALMATALKNRIPFEAAILTGQVLFFLGQYYVWQGSILYKGLARANVKWITFIGLLAFTILAISLITENNSVRLIVSSLVAISFSLLNAWALSQRYDGKYFIACRAISILLLIHAGFFAFRLIAAVTLQLQEGLLPVDLIQQFTFIEAIVMSVLIGMGYIVLITERLQHELRTLADSDSLTGALTRRAFYRKARKRLTEQQNNNGSVACMVLDMDHFKALNDQHGHLAGDEVLKRSVQVMSESLRSQDILARFGGEEFIILLPDADSLVANQIAERIRYKMENSSCYCGEQELKATVSIGLVCFTGGSTELNIDKLFEAADKALYQAKSQGRNRVSDFSELEEDLAAETA